MASGSYGREVGRQGGREAWRQGGRPADEIQVDFEVSKLLYRLNYSEF